MVKERSVEKEYLDSIIEQITKHGSYMFLTDDVVLAHARPEDGVNQMDISLAVFDSPATFPGGNKGRVIFVLAAVDQKKHLPILGDIFKVVGKREHIDKLLERNTGEGIYQYISTII